VKRHDETLEQRVSIEKAAEGLAGAPQPGMLLIFSGGKPLSQAVPLPGREIELGRDSSVWGSLMDPLLSRRHARISYDRGRFSVRDLGSRNGTFVDGEMLTSDALMEGVCVVRTGGTLFLLVQDVRPFGGGVEIEAGVIMGPTLRSAWDAIARAARFFGPLHLSGESGAGKELAARAFHRFGPGADGPFVAVNCAAIPEGVAERLLFGARKGAYSGAVSDVDGYVQAAHGGTLFLDEIGDLDPSVQAKLLRVVETHEALALGASRPTRVDIRICSATHRDLRAEVAKGRLREDLYFRIGRPEVILPPLRRRPEDIPWLIASQVKEVSRSLAIDSSLVEACLMRPWPGNVRELLTEVRAAAQQAVAAGMSDVKDRHLHPRAGQPLATPPPHPRPEAIPSPAQPTLAKPRSLGRPDRQRIEALMQKHAGVIQEVARELRCSRRQVGRWLDHYQIDRHRFRS
jgi:transcriptional regulator with GAF, ATPase, and Fis domain